MLFNKKLLQNKIDNFTFPDSERLELINERINKLQVFLKDKDLNKTKEKSIQGLFLQRVFNEILGFSSQLDGKEEYYLIQHPASEVDGKEADGALGIFSCENKIYRAVIELKDAKTPLDKKQTARKENYTPVEQAFMYSHKFDRCDWIIVSNFREIRLYHKSRGEGFFEEFNILELSTEKEFKRFYFLLCKENLLDKNRNSVLDRLVKETTENEKEITKVFYDDFKKIRKEIFEHILENNPDKNKKLLLEKTQKLLDRLIFIMFCEDSPARLLPENIVSSTYEYGIKSRERSDQRVWREFKNLFQDINEGRHDIDPPINAYNGGLFVFDEVLDNLVIKDEIWKKVKYLSTEYDFDSELNVNILGHIFEQSLSDLEQFKNELEGVETDKSKTKRKKDGIFYTPEYITRYIVEQTVGKYLEENPDKLEDIKILDPACGSGAFLNQAHTFLREQYKVGFEEGRIKSKYAHFGSLFNYNPAENDREILLNNLYGVDLNEESTEITKLALWLKTAKKTEPLQNLDNNIKCGNSLIDDPEFAGEKAFKWEEEFKGIMDKGGFDVVIGNPPYVNIQKIAENNNSSIEYLQKKYLKSAIKRFDLYTLFIELSLSLLKDNGYLSFIIPFPFLSQDYAEKLRKEILEKYSISKIIDLSSLKVFKDAEVKAILIVIKKTNKNDLCKVFKANNENELAFIEKYETIKTENWLNTENYQFRLELKDQNLNLIEKIKINTFLVKDICYVSKGASLHSEKTQKKGNEYIFEEYSDNYKKFIQGKECIDRYIIFKNKWLLYKREEHYRPMFKELFENPKLVIYKVTGDKGLIIAFDELNHYSNDSLYLAVPYKYLSNVKIPKTKIEDFNLNLSEKFKLKYILTILNSKLMNYYFKNKFGYNLNVYPDDIKRLPIKNATPVQQESLEKKAEQMIELNKTLHETSKNAFEFIKEKYNLTKTSQKLEKFWQLGFNPFVDELKKLKAKLTINEEEELRGWYKKKQANLNGLEDKIQELDKTIDREVYQLYGLTDEEIKIIEEN